MKGMTGRRRAVRFIAIAALAVLFFSVAADNAFARGGFRGGGFRMSRGFRSFGGRTYGRSGSFFGWGRATRRAGASEVSRFGTRRNTATAIGGSRASMATQRSLYSAARRNGTIFNSREQAAQAFRSRYANRYSSRFASRPSSRPGYIPRTTTVNGRPVNVVYSPQHGGYGYVDPALGHWVFFNALAHAAILNSLMASNYYWWGPAPVYAAGGRGFFSWAMIIFFAFMAISALTRFLRSRGSGWY